MIKFVILAAVFLVFAWWIGSIPGTFTAQSGSYSLETSIPVAIVLVVAVVILLTVLLRVTGGLRRAPGSFFFWRGLRRQRLGEIATQRGIVALAAGDEAAAQTEAKRARNLLGDQPLVLLLTAESARLAGKQDAAQAAFSQLAAHKDMAFLGHRGLVRHHLTTGDHETADTHAQAAEASYPGSAWLKGKRLEIALKKRDWAAALGLTRNPAQVAALATAAATASDNPRQAVGYAKQAVKADPSLAPAIVAYASALRKIGRLSAARRALTGGWKRAPHPLIAQSFIAPFPTALERAQTAADLAAANPGHPESEILLAQTSLDAKLTGEARRHAEAAVAAGLSDDRTRSLFGALGATGNLISTAPASHSSWVCTACHASQPDWHPVCPQCHKAGTLSWNLASGTLLA